MDTASKDNVQTTIKNLEDKILQIEKLLEKGQDCLIFQYGSSSIKFNRANDVAPRKINNIIAHKRTQPVAPVVPTQSFEQLDQAILDLEHFSNELKPLSFKGKPRGKVEVDLRWMNRQLEEQDKFEGCLISKEIESKQVVFEDEVYMLTSNPEYIVRQPIQYGFFDGPQAIDDLYLLTLYITNIKLGIPTYQMDTYSVILIIPDIFHRNQVKSLVDMLLRLCGFKQIYIHLESVLACFGANQQQACVVDIGSDKINICCVDEGVILPGSYVRKNFGSRDIDLVLSRIIQRKHMIVQPKKGLKLDPSLPDMQQMKVLKERLVQFQMKDDKSNYLYDMHTFRDGKEERFQVAHTDAICLAPLLYFEPQIGNAIGKPQVEEFDFTSRLFEMFYDPEDNLEDLSGGVQLSWCWGSKEKETQYQQKEETYTQLHPYTMQPLDWMICYSLAAVLDAELRPKFASNILLVGGGANMVDLAEELEQRVIRRSADFELDVEKFEVKSMLREDYKPQNVSWLGASVLPKTESMNEMWITRLRWIGDLEQNRDDMEDVLDQFDGDVGAWEKKVMQYAKREKEREKSAEWGIKHLKEKIPFVW